MNNSASVEEKYAVTFQCKRDEKKDLIFCI